MTSTELAAIYAALILVDDGAGITSDKILTLTTAASVDIEPIWATLLAKALEGKNIKDMLSNIDICRSAPLVNDVPSIAPASASETPGQPHIPDEPIEDDDDLLMFPVLFDF